MSKSSTVIIAGLILVVLAYHLILPHLTDHHGQNPLFRARTEMVTFGEALKQFNIACGRYPTTAEGLNALIERPSSISATQWHQFLVLRNGAKSPTDPWGHAYIYKCPGLHNTNGFDLSTLGPPGQKVNFVLDNWTPPPAQQ